MLEILKNKFIKFITLFYNPLVLVQIGNQKIKAPLSHPLKNILKKLPQFGFNVTRLVQYTHQYYPDTKAIDIGANIGDTAALINNYKNLPILCIDGDPQYFKLLEQNTTQYSEVHRCLTLIGENDEQSTKTLVRDKGTASLEETGKPVTFRSLENILAEFSTFQTSKFLKIDTDGYDTIILKGAKKFLAAQQPVIFFEYDPFFILKQREDPFQVFELLKECGYEYLLIYQNIGDYLVSIDLSTDTTKIVDLVNYYSGREGFLYADICAFAKKDKALFETARKNEIDYFTKLRNFSLTYA
ncbi:MAG: FkbM family methyltransferase [Flavisolibacter sp.]|nr:FkbM family methyltransferase [Flavisolibacter sp.]